MAPRFTEGDVIKDPMKDTYVSVEDEARNIPYANVPSSVTREINGKVGTKTGNYPTTVTYIDEEGNTQTTGGFYDTADGPFSFLNRLSELQKQNLLQTLYAKGLYEGRTPSFTNSANDQFAIRNLFTKANDEGKDWQSVFLDIQELPDVPNLSGGRKVTVTNPADIKYVLKQTAQKLLGRNVDEATMERFVQAVQAEERRSAYGSTQAADIGVQAEEQIKEEFAVEERASRMADFAGVMDQMIKGLAV